MLLRLVLLAIASMASGFGALRASVVFESYILLTGAMLLLMLGAGLLFWQPQGQPARVAVSSA